MGQEGQGRFKALSRPLFSDRLCPHYNLSIEQDRTYLEHLIQTHQELQLGSVEEITDTLVSASPSMILYWEKIALFIHTSHLNACVYNYIYIFSSCSPVCLYLLWSSCNFLNFELWFISGLASPQRCSYHCLSSDRRLDASHASATLVEADTLHSLENEYFFPCTFLTIIVHISRCAHRNNLTHRLRI